MKKFLDYNPKLFVFLYFGNVLSVLLFCIGKSRGEINTRPGSSLKEEL
jgi:hypothetical protein